MRAHFRAVPAALAAVLVCSVCVTRTPAAEQPDAARVSDALDELNRWLGDGAKGWDAHLNLTGLREQLGKGDDADPSVVNAVVEKLDGGAAGLELPRFRALRSAAAAWTEQLAIAQAGSLSDAALASETRFAPPSEEQKSRAKARLESAAAALDAYLSGENGRRWRAFLEWDNLQGELQSDQPALDKLNAIYRKLTSDHVGLELPVFANVADALDAYVSALAAARDDLKDQFGSQLKGLADELNQYAQEPNEALAVAIGGRLGWLERMGQVGGLIGAVRQQYSRPNLFVQLSERLVGAGIVQDVDDVGPVRDYILGTSISGTGHTRGQITVELVPNEQAAMLDILLKGTTATKTVGYNGPATIHTTGTVAIAGRKRVLVDENGFRTYKATGAANTNTRITGIGGGAMVQRVASRRVSEQKSQAERIAADHAGMRVRDRLENQSAEQLSQAHAQFRAKFRDPLLRRREFPELLKFRTTDDALFVTGMKANRTQLGAPSEPPSVEGQFDMVVRVHETMINNMAAALLAGVTLHEAEVQQKVIDLRGELPEELKSDENQDPWSITFANTRPVTVQFADDGMTITVRGQRYTSGDRDFRAMNVSARYKAQVEGNGLRLVRQGDLEVLPPGFVPGRSRMSTQQISLRTLLEKRFGKILSPEIQSEGLELPGNWAKAGRLDLKAFNSSAGWLAAAWLQGGESPRDDAAPKPQDRVASEQAQAR